MPRMKLMAAAAVLTLFASPVSAQDVPPAWLRLQPFAGSLRDIEPSGEAFQASPFAARAGRAVGIHYGVTDLTGHTL